MTEIEAAEFADYLRDERERREARVRAGGMYRRAMMRAYAEAVGAERELAITRSQPATAPALEAARTREIAPANETAARPVAPPLTAPPAAALPQAHRRRGSPSRPLVGMAALTLAIAAAAIIWSQTAADPEPATTSAAIHAPQAAIGAPQSTPQAPQPAARGSAPAAAVRRPAASGVVSRTAALPRPTATDGTLSVTSQPAGARVTVNGIGWGETPVTIRHLEFGQKRIRLTLQGYISEERLALLTSAEPSARARVVLRRRVAPPLARAPVAGAR